VGKRGSVWKSEWAKRGGESVLRVKWNAPVSEGLPIGKTPEDSSPSVEG